MDQLGYLHGGEIGFFKFVLEGNKAYPRNLNLPSDSDLDQKVILQTYQPSGLLIDNAMNLVQPYIPDY